MLYGYDEHDIVQSIGYEATITLNNEKIVTGYLYVIDPCTKNIVLYKDQQVQVIMNHVIKAIKIDKEKYMNIDTLLGYSKENPYTEAWMTHRQQKVITHLRKHHIPLEQKDTMIYVLGARIEPPYTATSVVCDNAIIRKRVRDLLHIMQHD